MKFADMPSGKIKRWVSWARSHDWGAEAFYNEATGSLDGCEEWQSGTAGAVMVAERSFDNPQALRDWAGY